MASAHFSVSRSLHPILKRQRPHFSSYPSSPRFAPNALLKSHPCPLWSSSFSFCLQTFHRSTSPYLASSLFSSLSPPSMASSVSLEAKHVRPGIRALLKKLESDLDELEKTMEPLWPKLVEPLEKIVDRLTVVWGMVNHLKAVKVEKMMNGGNVEMMNSVKKMVKNGVLKV
ncbi:hypothetical protein V6N12_068151 [Hibiscus sabdariffa]|uniref:Oligopeptidase A N-terminal domain-containing protein n=1 Tax=Hibiscus sabdariffa TaxID=183260 RepID=A0ABR2FP85_9ROSI